MTGSYNEVAVLHLINLTLSAPQGHKKKKVKVKGLGRNISYLV